MNRTEQRAHIFKLVFESEFNQRDEMPEQVALYFETKLPNRADDLEKIRNKTCAILDNKEEIDKLLNEKTTGWKTSRMNKVDLSILRVAVYEILWDDEVPFKVAVNEAVELAKEYSGKEGPGFVNGVLAKFAL